MSCCFRNIRPLLSQTSFVRFRVRQYFAKHLSSPPMMFIWCEGGRLPLHRKPFPVLFPPFQPIIATCHHHLSSPSAITSVITSVVATYQHDHESRMELRREKKKTAKDNGTRLSDSSGCVKNQSDHRRNEKKRRANHYGHAPAALHQDTAVTLSFSSHLSNSVSAACFSWLLEKRRRPLGFFNS